MLCQIFVHRLNNIDFILVSKIAELNQNKSSKQPDFPDTVWKLYFNLEKKNNSTISKTFYTWSTEPLFLKYEKISKKAATLGSFLQCLVNVFLGFKNLWNRITKNFQVKHGQSDSFTSPQNICF